MKDLTTTNSSNKPEADLGPSPSNADVPRPKSGHSVNIKMIDQVLNSLFDHKVEHAKSLLKELDLPTEGLQKELRTELRVALINGHLSPNRVISLIREIERWGCQHIYFFKSPENLGNEWDTEAKVMAQLKEKNLLNLYTKNPKWLIPSSTCIESLSFNYPTLTISVVMPRTWNERDKSLDVFKGEMFTLGYRKRMARALSTFEWNVETGQAFLTIPQLKSGDYSAEKSLLLATISEVLHVKSFELCKLNKAIEKTMKKDDVLIRGLGIEVATGEKLSAKSRSKKHDVFENTDVAAALSLLEGAYQNDGNFYLPLLEDENKTFRCRMHPDHRLSFYSQLNESEVRNVIAFIQSTF
jgi:hypothetical protein